MCLLKSNDGKISAEMKASIKAHNDKALEANPGDAIYFIGRCFLEDNCHGPIMELRPRYVCDTCDKIYHNIVCREYSESSSVCFNCSVESKKVSQNS